MLYSIIVKRILEKNFILEKLALSKKLMSSSLRFLFINLNNCPTNLDSVLHRKNHHLAVVVDANCENFTAVLSKVSKHRNSLSVQRINNCVES